MQLKLKRTQREAGFLSKNVIFCLDARVDFTSAEQQHLTRYKLWGEVIYNSEAQKRAAEGRSLAAANARATGVGFSSVDDFLESSTRKVGYGLKAAALAAVSGMRLTITIGSLSQGQHIECRDLAELMGAEEAIMDACRNTRAYLELASTFDGRETVFDFTEIEPQVVAAASPETALIAPMQPPPIAALSQPSPTVAPRPIPQLITTQVETAQAEEVEEALYEQVVEEPPRERYADDFGADQLEKFKAFIRTEQGQIVAAIVAGVSILFLFSLAV